MSQLKSYRSRHRMTQQELADALKVSQQTVARWESADGSIPAKYLKDLAILFSAKVSDFVSAAPPKVRPINAKKLATEPPATDETNDDTPYGTLELVFRDPRRAGGLTDEIETVDLPISESERMRVLAQMEDFSALAMASASEGPVRWIGVETLDQRCVLINPRQLETLHLQGDDVVAMPHYWHPEVYRALDERVGLEDPSPEELAQPDSPISAQLLAQLQELREALGGENAALEYMSCARATLVDGRRLSELLDDDLDLWLALEYAIDNGEPVHPDQFLPLGDEGYYRRHYVRMGSVRMIEIPLQRWEAYRKAGAEEADT